MAEGKWRTPLGEVAIDRDLAARILKSCPVVADDSSAHRFEHAIEVELPFLQTLCPALQIVPITVGTSGLHLLEELGRALAEVVRSSPGDVLIIASSDMNHYEDDDTTRMKDHKAIKAILGPAVAMLTATKLLGATSAELVQYATSAETSGDKEMCVGYAGIVVR
jgi:AmmeMemoRadiSam system protein B